MKRHLLIAKNGRGEWCAWRDRGVGLEFSRIYGAGLVTALEGEWDEVRNGKESVTVVSARLDNPEAMTEDDLNNFVTSASVGFLYCRLGHPARPEMWCAIALDSASTPRLTSRFSRLDEQLDWGGRYRQLNETQRRSADYSEAAVFVRPFWTAADVLPIEDAPVFPVAVPYVGWAIGDDHDREPDDDARYWMVTAGDDKLVILSAENEAAAQRAIAEPAFHGRLAAARRVDGSPAWNGTALSVKAVMRYEAHRWFEAFVTAKVKGNLKPWQDYAAWLIPLGEPATQAAA